MQNKVFDTSNIEVLWNNNIKEIVGTEEGFTKSVNGIILENTIDKSEKKLNVEGVFIAIGHKPNSELFNGQLEMHDNGYLKTKPGTTQTSVEGVFAAGDVQDFHYRQAVSAAGTGCMSAIEAERYLAS
jgi:thioredoxin reductase (NADPH)